MSILRLFAATSFLRMLGGGTQLVFTLLIARLFAPAAAGEFFFLFAVLTIGSVIARLGTEVSALREIAIARQSRDLRAMEREILPRFLLVLVASLCAAGPYLFVSTLGPAGITPLDTAIGAGALVVAALAGLASDCLKAIERPAVALLTQNVTMPAVATVSLLGFAVWHVVSVTVALCAVLIGYIVSLLVAAVCLGSALELKGMPVFSGGLLRELRRHLSSAPSLLAGVVAPVTMQWSGTLILGILTAPEVVAGYTVAARLASVVGLVNSAAASVVGPKMAVSSSLEDAAGFARIVHATGLAIFALSALPILSLVAFSGPLLRLFGEEYSAYSQVLLVLMIGQLVAAAIGHGGQALVSAGRYRLAAVGPAVAVVLYLGCLFLAVPKHGAIGASFAIVAGVIAGHLAAGTCLRKSTGVWPFPVLRSEWVSAVGGRL